MNYARFKHKLPGYIGAGLCICVTGLWVYWGVPEMFHEGWYAPFEWLFFLLPAGVCLLLTLVALTWPRLGGALLIVSGSGFYALVVWRFASMYGLDLYNALSWFPASGLLVLVGALFLYEGRRKRLAAAPSHPRWWRRNLRYLLAIGIPTLLGVGLAVEPALRVAGRVDDGDRGARTIAGNGVTLTWAPAGPGWKTSAGSVTWNQIALYGLPPVGFEGKGHGREGQCTKDTVVGCATAADMQQYNVCRYLSEDGTRLMDTPQGHWRMPTTDELVRSLVRHGANAGCAWNGRLGRQPCAVCPDKETPLWDPTTPVIYYWSADECDARSAYIVACDWWGVGSLEKFSGLGSCGYRCVRAR